MLLRSVPTWTAVIFDNNNLNLCCSAITLFWSAVTLPLRLFLVRSKSVTLPEIASTSRFCNVAFDNAEFTRERKALAAVALPRAKFNSRSLVKLKFSPCEFASIVSALALRVCNLVTIESREVFTAKIKRGDELLHNQIIWVKKQS